MAQQQQQQQRRLLRTTRTTKMETGPLGTQTDSVLVQQILKGGSPRTPSRT